MDGIRTFRELQAAQQATAGGKGRVLARLFQAGYPVPDGLVILPTAFSGDDLSSEAWTAVQAHLDRMRRGDPGITFAVRSSAVSEDSARASFAGEFESVLDVATNEAVREAIHTAERRRPCRGLHSRPAGDTHPLQCFAVLPVRHQRPLRAVPVGRRSRSAQRLFRFSRPDGGYRFRDPHRVCRRRRPR